VAYFNREINVYDDDDDDDDDDDQNYNNIFYICCFNALYNENRTKNMS